MPILDMPALTQTWPLLPSVIGLIAAALVIIVAGTRITGLVDEIADRTGWGEAIAGAVLLGAATSLPGLVTLTTGALAGDAAFALANPVGGILIQTVWLAIAYLVYRRVNLEHAAASSANILQSVILVALLAVPVIGYATPSLSLLWVHPASLAITSGISSLPELVTLLAAVRIRALTLGVGDIVGGNVFDALQITVADLAYRDGPLYADAGPSGLLLLGAAILTTGMLTAGLLMRDRRGIGFEGVAIPLVYVLAIVGVAYLG